MANVTVSLPDDIYRRARIRAAEESTSVSGLVRRLLLGVGTEETEFERRRRLQDETLGSIKRFAAADRLTRDEVHGRFDGLICAAARRLDVPLITRDAAIVKWGKVRIVW